MLQASFRLLALYNDSVTQTLWNKLVAGSTILNFQQESVSYCLGNYHFLNDFYLDFGRLKRQSACSACLLTCARFDRKSGDMRYDWITSLIYQSQGTYPANLRTPQLVEAPSEPVRASDFSDESPARAHHAGSTRGVVLSIYHISYCVVHSS